MAMPHVMFTDDKRVVSLRGKSNNDCGTDGCRALGNLPRIYGQQLPHSSPTSAPPPSTLTIGETLYTMYHGNILLQNLADGTPGPAVGSLDSSGSVTLDEELAAGEWVGELLTATTIRREALLNWPSVPASILESIRNGGASQWCNAMDAASVARCRAAVEQLDVDGGLRRRNHAQASTTRGDRVGFVRLTDEGDGDDDDDDGNAPCPPELRRGFELLESVGAQLEVVLGCGRLLVPRLGMVAVYDDPRFGYVRHMDNERVPATRSSDGIESAARGSSSSAPGCERHCERQGLGTGERRDVEQCCERHCERDVEQWRNFRVLTAILYLNAPDWSADDGGMLRCYAPDAPPGAPCTVEVVPHGGTVVVFPSCTVPHEVFPARRPRYAITLWFVSAALLRDTPEERAAAAAATLVDAAARRKRARALAAAADAKAERKRQRPLPSTPPPTPSSPAPPNTAHLAAVWEAAARCESQSGAFSFGFGP